MMSEPKTTLEVIVLGAAAVDWIAKVKELPPRDGIAFADQYLPFAGGSGANAAEGLARLGYAVRFLGVLGDDEGGRMLLRVFRDVGVDTGCIRVLKGERSAACFIAVDSSGQRMIFALGGVALYDKAEEVHPDWLREARVLYITDAYPEVAIAAIANLGANARVVFSPGGLMVAAGEAYLRPILERTDVLILNRVEAESLTKEMDLQRACLELGLRGPKVVLLTLGDQGVLVAEKGSVTQVPAVEVDDVVDTTGAGDAFSTGVIAGILEGLDWKQAAHLGCRVAAIKIRHFGSRTGLPERMQVQAWLDAKSRKNNEVML
ncbi:MAG: carbohydrate kinase family protein [Chloroflexi bacterium]|nr:carbohydrate kinase family protein [Chloroflexota bacterium]